MKHYPLSSSQLDFWFDQILHPHMPLYNIGGYVRINGPIDPDLFQQALDRVIRENDALRIILHEGKDLPTQTFAEDVSSGLDFHDFSRPEGGPESAHESALAWMQRAFEKPFPLYEKPLFRFALCKVADDRYYWLKAYHHIISDGWAISLIVQRVASAYNTLANEESSEARDASLDPSPYRDFVENDKRYLGSERFSKAKDYWRNKYRELPEPLLIPHHAVKFQGQTIPSQRSTLRLSRDFYDRLVGFAEEHRTSTFHVILGAFYCYFTRTAEREDFAVGLPTLNRTNTAFKQTVGSFAGINPAWFRLGTDLDFVALMAGIRRELQADYRHQRLPMSEINRQTALQYGRGLFDLTLSYAGHDYDVHFDGASTRSTFLANGFYPQSHGLFVTIEEFHRIDDVNIYFETFARKDPY
uniref:Condensation domain-containing protein n=1 Tax=Candidatus Kentrum sp. LPFa TaxID=2126335 RepID=A0A450X467_9GAMM|nr:MAG: Condensation domain-containing protein [Candidatus Kentron sp. LPFa]